MTFALTHKQKLLRSAAASDAGHILAYGGSRSGKTFGFTYCVAVRAFSAPGSRHLIGRLHNIDVRQAVMMDTFPSVMKAAFPGVPWKSNKTDQVVYIGDDAEIWFTGFDDKERTEKILGKEFATIYPNECSQIPYDTILTLRTRLAQNVDKLNGDPLALKAYYDLNPVGRRHWSYLEFIEGVRPENGQPLPAGRNAFVHMNPLDNPHLPASYLEELALLPERQRQRFFEGRYQSEVPGTLWPIDRLNACRIERPADPYAWAADNVRRIVIGVDPSGSDGIGGDSQGIVVAGLLVDKKAIVLEDATCCLSPAGWGERVVRRFHEWGADSVVAEANYGGAMVKNTIQTVDPKVPVKLVTASRGKHVRAEPIAALYESGRVKHLGAFPDLEDQMTMFTTDGYQGSGSPDRADANVWALTELMLGAPPPPNAKTRRVRGLI